MGSESDLCARFGAAVERAFAVHPETSGWDLLLVHRATGIQVGVHAKLRGSLQLLVQAVSTGGAGEGPDVRAVLVPEAKRDFRYLAGRLGLHVFDAAWISLQEMLGAAGDVSDASAFLKHAPKNAPYRRCWVPPVEVKMAAGVPGPRTISPWKVKAMLLCARLRQRGYVTRADFKELKLSPTWWLQDRGKKHPSPLRRLVGSRPSRYEARPGVQLPDEKNPELAEALRAR